MKKLLTLCIAITLLCAVGCSESGYDDSLLRNELTDLANRVAKLEQLCQQMNTNISSLQTIVNALQQNDFITAVVPVTQGGKVIGYTITFSRSGAITIYHGNDGATPQISVKQESDGIYYWTLNGEWLLDASGNKIVLRTEVLYDETNHKLPASYFPVGAKIESVSGIVGAYDGEYQLMVFHQDDVIFAK